jgi:hypothetical protein
MPGIWHNNMESQFPKEMQEIKFFCSANNTRRRADILLSDNRTCEIQHSFISEREIINRFNDWNKFGKDIVWLLDGNDGIEFDELSTGNYLLKFKQLWKYKSFVKTYDFILIEKDDMVFKIELNKIKSGIIELKESKTLQETIDCLKTTPDKIWNYWGDDNVVKSTLIVHQQGAGNGKTYGIWKSITENLDRKSYIIVTKQHSAKTVIYKELEDQQKRYSNGEEEFHIENITNDTEENTDKHYVIKYTHKKSKRECTVIIGTIDSFCYGLSTSNTKGSSFFKGIVDNIKEKGATKIRNGYMMFGGQYIQLSKESEIWIDEVQDLPENYYHAMIKLMYETSCYMNIVGDKLQSLEHQDNFLTSIIDEGLPNIKVVINEPINKNRRIKVTNMGDKINELVNFNKYELPSIECDDKIPKESNEEPIKIIELPIIYANDKDEIKVCEFCDKILKLYDDEVKNNNYNPNDFLIVFPIMKGNVMAEELQTKIQEFWIKRKDDKEYIEYVYLHKHTEGTVINTKDSVNATRIMSIRSSKGDGRKVVFILGITEESLKIVSNNKIGLVYESHLHVALTRAKKQIYFGLTKNNDDIHRRLGEIGYVEYLPNIDKRITLEKINDLIDKNKLIEILNKNNVNSENYMEKEINNGPKETVDWGYHCIKYYTFYYNVILNITNNKQYNLSDDKSQLFVKLRIISNYFIKDLSVKEFYKYLNKYQDKNFPDSFPLCKLTKKPEYEKYRKIIHTTMNKVKKYIKEKKINELNVYESIILTYMIQVETCKKYADISPMEIYNITDFFKKNTNKEQELLNNIQNIKDIINQTGIHDYQNVNWNISKMVELDSGYECFKLLKSQFPIIGNNDKEIIHIVLKSNISQLNFWETMIEVLLERFLIYNPKSEDDKEKFKDKKINTYLFLLDKNSFIKIDWDWDKVLIKEIKDEINVGLNRQFQNKHSDIYKYFTHIRTKQPEVWEKTPDKIIDQIIQKCNKMHNCPDYITKVLDDINTKIEDGDDYNYVNNFKTFNNKLNKKLDSRLKKYLEL